MNQLRIFKGLFGCMVQVIHDARRPRHSSEENPRTILQSHGKLLYFHTDFLHFQVKIMLFFLTTNPSLKIYPNYPLSNDILHVVCARES
jgi:hypothetical protein